MLRHRERLWLPLCLIIALAATAFVFAQDAGARALQPGAPVTGSLDAGNIAQVYSIAGVAGDSFALTASNEAGVPLAIIVTNAQGVPVTQAVDEDTDGELVVEELAFAEDGTFYITVFQAGGVNAVSAVDFTLVVDVLGAAATPEAGATVEPTVQPTITA